MILLAHSMMLALLVPPPPVPEPAMASPAYSNSVRLQPWVDGAVYSLETAPGQVSSIALEPGEKLVSVAAGDTSQWVIGDTASGSDANLRTQILIKPVAPGLRTNLVIATDRRLYLLALESRIRSPIVSLRWTYAGPNLIALRALGKVGCAPRSQPDLESLNFDYRIDGDAVTWRPVRVFDDGRQTFIEFPPSLAQADAPPLFLKGADGQLELVNYRVKGRYYVVDRIFAKAELRLGEKRPLRVLIVRLSREQSARPARRPS